MVEQVQNPHFSSNEVTHDICDGEFFQQHPIFKKYPDALQFIIYYGDLEVCNSLGVSARVHKLIYSITIFTYTVEPR